MVQTLTSTDVITKQRCLSLWANSHTLEEEDTLAEEERKLVERG